MGKKQKKPGKGKEKTERKTAKASEKRSRREEKLVSEEDDIDAILVLSSQFRPPLFCSSISPSCSLLRHQLLHLLLRFQAVGF
jgi:hypothetical protein